MIPVISAGLIATLLSAPLYYIPYTEVTWRMNEIAANPHVQIMSLGQSIEGRDIRCLHMGSNTPYSPAVLIMGAMHSRETVTVNICLDIADTLADNYGSDSDVTYLMDSIAIYVIPVLNVDGYSYDSGIHYWRKNRRPVDLDGDGYADFYGVDLNRNFSVGWGGMGWTSGNVDTQWYHGTGPFSEPESRALRDFCDEIHFAGSLSYHSFGRMIMYPWAFTTDSVEDGDLAVFESMADGMNRAMDSRCRILSSSESYECSGDFSDWLYAGFGTIAFTVEVGTAFYPAADEAADSIDAHTDGGMKFLRQIADRRQGLDAPRVPGCSSDIPWAGVSTGMMLLAMRRKRRPVFYRRLRL